MVEFGLSDEQTGELTSHFGDLPGAVAVSFETSEEMRSTILQSSDISELVEIVRSAANINALAEAGVTLGCTAEGTMYCPDDPVTRGQMAAFLHRGLGG